MAAKWSYNDTIKLIRLYEARPCVWDMSSSEYRDKVKKPEAMKAIANELKRSEEECQKKFRNLRTVYAAETKKIQRKVLYNGCCIFISTSKMNVIV